MKRKLKGKRKEIERKRIINQDTSRNNYFAK